MQSSKLERAINDFKATYKEFVEHAEREVPLSRMPKDYQDEFWRRDRELHPSSFPFCGLRAAYERLIREADPIIKLDFGRDYFLPVGTATHSGLQKWLGHSKKILGNWKCTNAKCAKLHTFQTEPKKCSCGNKQYPKFEYEELGGKWGKNTSWHTDSVFQKSVDGNNLWVVDYKTSSEYAIETHRKTKTLFPYISNRFQIETYIPLIESTFNVKLAGWMLVYVARDNPRKTWKTETVGGTIDNSRREQLMERLTQADTDFGKVLKVKEQPIRVFKSVLQTKLCEDRDFYDNFVHDPYDPCPLAKVCFNSEKLRKRLKRAISESEG